MDGSIGGPNETWQEWEYEKRIATAKKVDELKTLCHDYFKANCDLRQKRSERLAVFTQIAVHQPFERTGMPFDRLELTVRENSSAVWTARTIRSRKFISRLIG